MICDNKKINFLFYFSLFFLLLALLLLLIYRYRFGQNNEIPPPPPPLEHSSSTVIEISDKDIIDFYIASSTNDIKDSSKELFKGTLIKIQNEK